MKIEVSDVELVALARVLTYVRFECKEYESRYLAGSPHVAELFKRVSEATFEYYKSQEISVPDEWPSIETIQGYLDIIRTRIVDTDNWNDLNQDRRIAFLNTLTYPYKVSSQTIADLIQFGDEKHSVES